MDLVNLNYMQKKLSNLYTDYCPRSIMDASLWFHCMPPARTVAARLTLREDLLIAVLTTDTPMRQRSNLFCPSHNKSYIHFVVISWSYGYQLYSFFAAENLAKIQTFFMFLFSSAEQPQKATLRVELH